MVKLKNQMEELPASPGPGLELKPAESPEDPAVHFRVISTFYAKIGQKTAGWTRYFFFFSDIFFLMYQCIRFFAKKEKYKKKISCLGYFSFFCLKTRL